MTSTLHGTQSKVQFTFFIPPDAVSLRGQLEYAMFDFVLVFHGAPLSAQRE